MEAFKKAAWRKWYDVKRRANIYNLCIFMYNGKEIIKTLIISGESKVEGL